MDLSAHQREWLEQRDERISQLEQLNATLAAEVDRMRPVIEAAHHWASGNPPVDRYQKLLWALRTYESSKPK